MASKNRFSEQQLVAIAKINTKKNARRKARRAKNALKKVS